MGGNDIFVGRQRELERFGEVLADPAGQAVVVVGPSGMGKTWLLNEIERRATGGMFACDGKAITCGVVRYQITENDGVDTTLGMMMDHAFAAAQVKEKSFDGTPRSLEQWRSFLNVLNIGDLALSLKRDIARHTRDQFIERMELISGRMKKNQRAVFIIDPEKYMGKGTDAEWGIVAKNLPERIKMVFAQRGDDVLVDSEVFGQLDNAVWIPGGKSLGVLGLSSVEDLLDRWRLKVSYSREELLDCLGRYEGYPYALGAALVLLEAGTTIKELPDRPEPVEFAERQWDKIGDRGDEAIRLFEALAVLEVPVPDDVIEAVGSLKSTTRKRLMNDRYLKHLVRREGEGQRIYHAILADVILGRMSDEEKRGYHERAAAVYRAKLKSAEESQSQPDELSAIRLSEHVREAEGAEAFVKAFVKECFPPLKNLGRLEVCVDLSKEGLEAVEEGSEGQAILSGNLGLIYRTQGKLAEAEAMLNKSLEINEKLGRLEGMASQYGNLGVIYLTQGKLDEAEAMLNKNIEIEKKLGRLEGIANNFGTLGLIYQMQGKLDEAEAMHKKSLEISEKLGKLEGMATDYGNLGLIYQVQGKLAEAEGMHYKSLEINEKLGRLEGMASDYGNMGGTYQMQGKLDEAEAMFNKNMEIEKKLGRIEGIANNLANMGVLLVKRGDLGRARQCWTEAVELYDRIGMPHMVEKTRGLIEGLGDGEDGIE